MTKEQREEFVARILVTTLKFHLAQKGLSGLDTNEIVKHFVRLTTQTKTENNDLEDDGA